MTTSEDKQEESIREENAGDIAELFERAEEATRPSKESFRHFLRADIFRAGAAVTDPREMRYTGHRQEGSIISSYYYDMQNNWKVLLPGALVLVLVVVAVVGLVRGTPGAQPAGNDAVSPALDARVVPPSPEGAGVEVKPRTAKVASGSVDDILATLDAEADAEASTFSDTDADIALVSSDKAVISDYATAYEDSAF